MFRSSIRASVFILFVAALFMTVPTRARNPRVDFGAWVQDQLQSALRAAVRLQASARAECARPLQRRRQPAGDPGRRRTAGVAGVELGRLGRRPDRVLAQR